MRYPLYDALRIMYCSPCWGTVTHLTQVKFDVIQMIKETYEKL